MTCTLSGQPLLHHIEIAYAQKKLELKSFQLVIERTQSVLASLYLLYDEVTRTALSITPGQHYVRGHLTLSENHLNSTKKSKNFDPIVGPHPRNDASISRLF